MSKHTKGPWEIIEHDWAATGIVGGRNDYVCLLKIEPSNDECEVAMSNRMAANAQLIAAAPELLEALQEVFVIGDRLVSDVYGHEFKEKARAAIAKATGEQA